MESILKKSIHHRSSSRARPRTVTAHYARSTRHVPGCALGRSKYVIHAPSGEIKATRISSLTTPALCGCLISTAPSWIKSLSCKHRSRRRSVRGRRNILHRFSRATFNRGNRFEREAVLRHSAGPSRNCFSTRLCCTRGWYIYRCQRHRSKDR